MPPTRKRKHSAAQEVALCSTPAKKRTHRSRDQAPASHCIKHAVLSQYFFRILTLRDYVLQSLPSTSKVRRKTLASIGLQMSADAEGINTEHSVGSLLDTTLVGLAQHPAGEPNNHQHQGTNWTQTADESYITLSGGLAESSFSQSEVGHDTVLYLTQ